VTSDPICFERLEAFVTTIARHAEYRGKQGAIAGCLHDIDGRWSRGELSLEQRFRLYAILLRGTSLYRPLTATA
jgi:hypothetical protein